MPERPDLPEPFDRSLSRRMEGQARREFEAAESEAALLAARRSRLADVAWAAAQAGSRVTIRVGRRQVTGTPTFARNDLMSLETPNGRVDVCLPNIDALSVTPTRTEGKPIRPEVDTFVARAAMLQLTTERLEVVCRGGEASFEGTVAYVARDHLALATFRGQILVALEAVAYFLLRP